MNLLGTQAPKHLSTTAPWMRGPGVLKNLSGDTTTGLCGMSWCGWNGDPSRGWGFYCACGFCTPLRQSFSGGIELLEEHWHKWRQP
jgi:hypothetical protein